MKNSIALLILLLIVSSCKEEKKETIKELSIAEKIANAHGFEPVSYTHLTLPTSDLV